jgi:hypothetical protein
MLFDMEVPPFLMDARPSWHGAAIQAGRSEPSGPAAGRCRLRDVTTKAAAGVLLIAAPIWFNAWFAVLARRFDYPDILRRPTEQVLARFKAGGSSLILAWWAFMASGGLLIAAAVLLSRVLAPQAPTVSLLALVVGVLAGLVQVLGLLRWVYLVPSLARMYEDPDADEAARAAAAVTFRAFHQYLGVGVGEHLGYLLTGAWTGLVGIAVLRGDAVATWLGWVALPIGAGLIASSAEFLGPNEEGGWELAGKAVPALYVLWSLWLVALGITLLV